MITCWTRLFASSNVASAGCLLARQLADDPPHQATHPGAASAWSASQAADKLAHFMQQREQRLAALQTLLSAHGIDFAPVLNRGDCGPLLAGLLQDAVAGRYETA